MVQIARRFYLRLRGVESGPFTSTQLTAMWVAGSINANSLYRVTNSDEWVPISRLEDALRFWSKAVPVESSAESLNRPVAEERSEDVPGTSEVAHKVLLPEKSVRLISISPELPDGYVASLQKPKRRNVAGSLFLRSLLIMIVGWLIMKIFNR